MPGLRICSFRRFGSVRPTFLLALVSFFALIGIFFLNSNIPPSPSLSDYDHRKISGQVVTDYLKKSRLNPFRQPKHAPARQKDDEYKGLTWWADWKWMSVPFSSFLTLDEDRTMLPPLKERPFVYCYYDATVKKTKEEKDAESALLLTWRRAWWAQGFYPVILSASEAMNNPNYDMAQRVPLDKDLKEDLMRWLAWESMGGGMMAQPTLLPMARRLDPMLVYLRRGEYPELNGWKNLDDGFFVGHAAEVSAAIRSVLDSPDLKGKKTVLSALSEEAIKIEPATDSLAYYSAERLANEYLEVQGKDGEGKGKGMLNLNKLINAHLHQTWRNAFPKGIEVLRPFPTHTKPLFTRAMRLAEHLLSCPDTPIPSSCPPNAPKCTPCKQDKNNKPKIATPARYHNSTDHFTIGTVPHPWTLATLSNLKETLDIPWIRRESTRDPWLNEVTYDLLGDKVSSSTRIMRFKEAVAGDGALAYTFWFPAEDMPTELDWQFGFSIPAAVLEEKASEKKAIEEKPKSSTSTKRAETENKDSKAKAKDEDSGKKDDKAANDKKEDTKAGENAKEEDTKKEESKPEEKTEEEDPATKENRIFEKAKRLIALTKSTDDTKLRASLEAWSMADTEVWRFARAFQARRTKVRKQWEDEEAKYSRGAGSEGGRSTWSKWQDAKGQ